MNYVLIFALGFFSVLSMIIFRTLFIKLNLVDRPSLRKRHSLPVPYCGGTALMLTLLAAVLVGPISQLQINLFILSLLIYLTSFWDDRFSLSPFVRLTIHISTSSLMIILFVFSGHYSNIHLLEASGFIGAILSFLILVISSCGTINAFNMSDGIDGLCSGLAILSNSALAIIFYLNDQLGWSYLLGVLIFSLIVFFCFNLSKRYKAFLGDSGSATLGFLTISFLYVAIFHDHILSVGAGIWFIGSPLMGMARVVVIRLLSGVSPFKPDRRHFHYMAVDGGVSYISALTSILIIQSFFCCLGWIVYCYHLNAVLSLSFFLLVFSCFTWFTARQMPRSLSCILRQFDRCLRPRKRDKSE